jgi:P-type E1-E2 ATPase
VTALKAIGRITAATGCEDSDINTLIYSDIGLAMGSGCTAAKEASDIVLIDNDFEATLRSVMWGRNIYHNISRFLQF